MAPSSTHGSCTSRRRWRSRWRWSHTKSAVPAGGVGLPGQLDEVPAGPTFGVLMAKRMRRSLARRRPTWRSGRPADSVPWTHGCRVGVFGAGGRMGATVCAAVTGRPRARAGGRRRPGPRRATDVDGRRPSPRSADAHGRGGRRGRRRLHRRSRRPAANLPLVRRARRARGGRHDRLHAGRLRRPRRSASPRSNCLVAPNFAIGAVLMMRFAELAAPYFETAEIIELHHDAKVDAPSGTAMMTVQRMAARLAGLGARPDQARGGRRGHGAARAGGGIHVHSVRLRGPGRPPGGAARHDGPDAHASATTPTTAPRSCPACCWR